MEIEKLHPWSERMTGIRLGVRAFWNALQDIKLPKEERIYLKAEYDLIMSDLRNTDKWIQGYRIGYRNYQTDKKGNLISCEAYFID